MDDSPVDESADLWVGLSADESADLLVDRWAVQKAEPTVVQRVGWLAVRSADDWAPMMAVQ